MTEDVSSDRRWPETLAVEITPRTSAEVSIIIDGAERLIMVQIVDNAV